MDFGAAGASVDAVVVVAAVVFELIDADACVELGTALVVAPEGAGNDA